MAILLLDPVALSCDVVYLKYQFHANGRPPFCEGRRKWPLCGSRRKWPLSRPDVDRTTPQCDVRMLIAALIFRDGETQNPGVKINDDIEILRKDLKPQRHGHLRMVAHPSTRGDWRAPDERPLCRWQLLSACASADGADCRVDDLLKSLAVGAVQYTWPQFRQPENVW